ncbi:hypothetical protein AnigIFM56816_000242 [Aspergillus niger]|nr:hypothetical protein AnigIFM56816_000242 [Aspergillus niger]
MLTYASLPAKLEDTYGGRSNTVKTPKGDGATSFNDYEELEIEVTSEPWEKYDPTELREVFYPIRLGKILNERDLTEHKLGAGGYTTAWMAHGPPGKKDVAVKVMYAGDRGDIELRIQNEIVRSVQDRSHLVTYLDTFLLKGNPFVNIRYQYSHVSCEAIAKSVGSPSQRRDYAPR